VVFENDLVADGYHKIKADCGTGTTEIFFGEKSGSDGIKGCLFKSGGTIKFQFDMSDTDIDKLGVYGCTFHDAGTITFQATAADKEVLNTTVDSSAEIIPSTIKFENFNIISSDGFGIRMIPSHGIKNGKIIAPGSSGIEIVPTADAQSFSFDNIVFSGADGISTYDVYSNTAYDLTINTSNGANPSHKNEAGSGTITIVSPKILTITGLPSNTEVTIVKTSDRSELYHIENSSGNVVYNYGAAEAGLSVDVLIHHIDYDPNIGSLLDYTLPAVNTSVPVALVDDPTYNNPV
jgi:hypothetical protein